MRTVSCNGPGCPMLFDISSLGVQRILQVEGSLLPTQTVSILVASERRDLGSNSHHLAFVVNVHGRTKLELLTTSDWPSERQTATRMSEFRLKHGTGLESFFQRRISSMSCGPISSPACSALCVFRINGIRNAPVAQNATTPLLKL
eukprot:5783200-Amphidinium_carterae.2